MTLPNFVVIGAAKAGTTSLHHWLRQHPDVFLPALKETFFFAYDPDDPEHVVAPPPAYPIRSLADYEALYANAGGARALGDVTPAYLNSPVAPGHIHRLIPGARLVVSLRDPIERLHSHAQMNVRLGLAADAVRETVELARSGRFTYAPKLRRYLDLFPAEQLHLIVFEELAADPPATVRGVLRFLELDDGVDLRVDTAHNPGGLPRSRFAQRLIEARALRVLRPVAPAAMFELVARLRRANLKRPPALDHDLRAELLGLVRDDVLETSELLGRDLSAWLDRSQPPATSR